MNPLLRKLSVTVAMLIAIGIPAAQAIYGFGQSPAAFADNGDETLRAAGYAFSIWTPIYLGMVAYTVYQWLPRNDASAVVRDTAPYAILAFAWCGAWIFFSALDQKWMTVGAIVIALFASLTGMTVAVRAPDGSRRDILFCGWPLAALGGWLTAATVLNILTVTTAEGLITPATAFPAALVGLLAAGALGIFTLRQTRLWLYAVPLAWGLVAVAVAERTGNPLVAAMAVALAAVIGIVAWRFRAPIAAPR